ncbi:MAG: hypothetical protein K6T64_11385 [Kyrpidia sp.]|nr:hypothetical protein [Kyrpidia sp.]
MNRRLQIEAWMPDWVWEGYSAEKLHHAVSLVENRGEGQALLGPSLPPLIRYLAAKIVHDADNLVSTAMSPAALVQEYNIRLPKWTVRYGISNTPFRLLTWHDEPPVLHTLQTVILDMLYEIDQMPLVLTREGTVLWAAVPEPVTPRFVLERFQETIGKPVSKVRFKNTTASVVLDNIRSLEDLRDQLELSLPQLLVVKVKDGGVAVPYAHYWASKCTGAAGTPLRIWDGKTERGNKQTSLVRLQSETPLPTYSKALVCAALLSAGGNEAVQKALEWNESVVRESLREMDIPLENLDPLTRRTVVAMQSALSVPDDILEAWADYVYGQFSQEIAGDAIGTRALTAHLGRQVGLDLDETEQSNPGVFEAHPDGGACLLCGAPATRLIVGGTMDVLVKSSAFNTRPGHKTDPWRAQGENYLCDACVARQRLWKTSAEQWRIRGGLGGPQIPLLVATPIRSWLYQDYAKSAEKEEESHLFSCVDVLNVDGWVRALPWNSTTAESLALAWEPRQNGLEEILGQMRNLAAYAAYSGEPVHAFIASFRLCPESFVYEPMPELVKNLLRKAGVCNPHYGVYRKDLGLLIEVLDAFITLLKRDGKGREALEAVEDFGWWSAAWCLFDPTWGSSALGREAQGAVSKLKEVYPMVNDEMIKAIALDMATIQSIKPNEASGNKWSLAMRRVLETYDRWSDFGDRQVLERAIADDLYKTLERGNILLGRDEAKTREVCLRVTRRILHIVKDMESTYQALTSTHRRFLVAAYEATFWEVRHAIQEERQKTKEVQTG